MKKVFSVIVIVSLLLGVSSSALEGRLLPIVQAWPPPTLPYMGIEHDNSYVWPIVFGPYPPSAVGSSFTASLYIKSLDSAWDLWNASFSLSFNRTLIDVVGGLTDITIDSQWTGFNSKVYMPGKITVYVENYNGVPSGKVLVATVKFTVMTQSTVPPEPPGYCDASVLTFSDVILYGQPFPGSYIAIPLFPAEAGMVVVYGLLSQSTSSTSVVCSPNPVSTGSPTTCTATVSGSNPTGTVAWSTNSTSGSFSQSVCTLSSGSCSTSYTDTAPGTVTITASYSGDSNNVPSGGSTTLAVSVLYTVTFTESDLPSTTDWTVTLNGVAKMAPGSMGQRTITFNEPNGLYPFSITPTGASPSDSGLINVEGNTNVVITYGSGKVPLPVFIHEIGLVGGTSWSATYYISPTLYITQSSTSQSIRFNFYDSGIYPFYVSCPGYSALPNPVDINDPVSESGVGNQHFPGQTSVIFIPSSNYLHSAAWDPVKNSYDTSNFASVWTNNGNCYGFSSTALLYFMHYGKGDTTYPFFPSQNTEAKNASELDLTGLTNDQNQQITLNNASLAIMLHQVFDTNAHPNKNLAGSQMQNFNSLKSSLESGAPMVLTMWNDFSSHSVVAWGIGQLADGRWAIAVYDPNYPEATQVAIYDVTTDTFSYAATGPCDHFLVLSPATVMEGLPSWFSSHNEYGETMGLVPDYYIFGSNHMASVESHGLMDKFSASGNSQTFACGIPDSSGVEEGDLQFYAIPESRGWPHFDPASNQSTVFISYLDNVSGQPVAYGYFLDATATQGLLNFTVTPSDSGLSISAGANGLNASVTFFSATEQGYSVSQVSNVTVDAMQTVNFTAPCVMSVVPAENAVGQGCSLPINVTITNSGAYAETFNVTVCANETETGNSTVIATFTNVTVDAGNSTTLTLTWDTTGLSGDYVISACVASVIGEAGTVYDAYAGSTVTVQATSSSGGGGGGAGGLAYMK